MPVLAMADTRLPRCPSADAESSRTAPQARRRRRDNRPRAGARKPVAAFSPELVLATSVSASSRISQRRCRPAPSSAPAAARGGSRSCRRRGPAGRGGTSPGRARRAPRSARSFVWRSRTSSTPIIRPWPRTSPISGCLSVSAAQAVHQVRADGRGVRDQLILAAARSSRAPRRTTPGCRRTCSRARPAARPSRRRARTSTPSGSPDAMPFAIVDDVRLDAEVLDREHLPGAAHARLHFVDDQQDAVLASSARAAAAGTASAATT